MVTMMEVARLAGVSTMTVSNVLNARPSVNQELRRRVLEAVDASGYVMNHAARSLRKGTTGVIGLALPEFDRPYSGQLASRVISQAAARGYRVVVEQTGCNVEGELASLSLSRTMEYEGLLMTAVEIGPVELERLGQTIPLVLLGERHFAGIADHVGMANFEGAQAATAHLIQRGCRRIAWLGFGGSQEQHPLRLRLHGYRDALASAGMPASPELEIEITSLTMESAANAIHQAIERGVTFDGVVAVTDTAAFGVMRGLADRGLRIPKHVRVIGFDDVAESSFSIPSLSSVAPDHQWMVEKALDLLISQINGTAQTRTEIVAPFQLALRESTK